MEKFYDALMVLGLMTVALIIFLILNFFFMSFKLRDQRPILRIILLVTEIPFAILSAPLLTITILFANEYSGLKHIR